MSWIVADGHRWSPHMFRGSVGRGTGYSAEPCGGETHIYGATSAEEAEELAALLREIERGVREAEPAATVNVYITTQNGRTAGAVVAHVTADDVAAFRGGPTHRAAIGRVRWALKCSTEAWMRKVRAS